MRRPIRAPSTALVLAVLTLIGMGGAPAAAQMSSPLVSVDWLADHIDDPNLVLLHVGPEEGYAAEHIPGAHWVVSENFAAPEDHAAMSGLNLEMPDPDALVDVLEELGVSDQSRIVVYFGTNWVTPSTRLLLTLDWIGLGDRTAILDGGMGGWKAAGHPVTAAPTPAPPRGALTPDVQHGLIVTAEWVRAHMGDDGYAIVDARDPASYDGIRATRLHREEVRKGHIPGAVNVPFNELFDDDLTLKSADELETIFREAGVGPGQTVIGYCHLGQFATAMLTAARAIGHDIVLYDGSFQDWGSRGAEFPVELPEGD